MLLADRIKFLLFVWPVLMVNRQGVEVTLSCGRCLVIKSVCYDNINKAGDGYSARVIHTVRRR